MSRRTATYHRFWTQLLERPGADSPLHEGAIVTGEYHMSASTGVDHMRFSYAIMRDRSGAELSRRGYAQESSAKRQRSYRVLSRERQAIEARFGDELQWIPTANTRNWRIFASTDSDGLRDVKSWPETQDAMIETMRRLERAMRPVIERIDAETRRAEKESKPKLVTPYRPVDEYAKGSERVPFAVDPEVIERGNRSHRAMQQKLAALAKAQGLKLISPGDSEPAFDVGWWSGKTVVLVECKSTTPANAEKQLRLGLGQILDYQHRAQRGHKRVVAVLAVEERPRSDRWQALCAAHDVTLVWPGIFHTLFSRAG